MSVSLLIASRLQKIQNEGNTAIESNMSRKNKEVASQIRCLERIRTCNLSNANISTHKAYVFFSERNHRFFGAISLLKYHFDDVKPDHMTGY